MGATPVCQITTAGCIRPDFAACLTYIQAAYRAIYGQDVILSADSQDGQFMALLANAIHDCNGETLAVYNAFSPATAQGEGLSSVVKINGIRRKSPTYSTCDFINVGQVGATITAGVVRDDAGNAWSLPDFTIPLSGQVLVTGTCQTIGAITLSSGAVDTANGKGAIATPQLGWQSAINPSAAVAGQPVESDSQLRQRQSLSTALPATTVTTSMVGTLSAIAGVGRVKIYENTTNRYDANGVPAHGISVVVEGGDPNIIAQAIATKKGQGVGTFGDTVVTLTDMYGRPMPVAFFRPKLTAVAWYVTLRAKTGYTLAVANMIRAGLADYTNRIGIGENQELSAAYPVANLTGTPQAAAFEIVGLVPKRADQTNDAYGDIAPPFNGALTCAPSDVIITVVNA